MGLVKIAIERVIRPRLFHVVAALISATYANLRISLNEQNPNATWQQLYDLVAPIPFGHRILIPVLSRPLGSLEILVEDCFRFWEFVATLVLLFSLRALLARRLGSARWATALALAFSLLLPCAFLITVDWPALFYPYDTPAMVFTTLGLLLAYQQRWVMLVGCAALATVNRETAVLIPLMFGILFVGRLGWAKWFAIGFAQLAAIALVKMGIGLWLADNPKPYGGALAWMRGEEIRVNGNLEWLSYWSNDLNLLFSLGFLPIAYLAVRSKLPDDVRRLVVIPFAWFLALLFVGNPFEPRIYGELLPILYFCVAIGLHAALSMEPGAPVQQSSIPSMNRATSGGKLLNSDAIDLVGIVAAVIAFIVAVYVINHVVALQA